MKVICQGIELSDAVTKVMKAMNNKSVSPILEGIKITAKDDCLTLFATDLDLAIEKKINADVLMEGETIVPGKFFGDLVRMLTNEQLEMTLDQNLKLKIRYTDGEVETKCLPVEEYPELERIEGTKGFCILSKELKELISKTIFSVSSDDGRPALKGCLFEAEDYTVSAVAIDGYRMALVKKPLEQAAEKFSMIVPARSLAELNRFLEDNDDIIQVRVQNSFMMVDLEHTMIMTRLLSGEFINYKQIISDEFSTNVIINREQFKNSLDRASILSRGEKNNLVQFEIRENLLYLISSSDDGANLKESIAINLVGKDVAIAFNSRYLLDCLKAIEDDYIKMNFNMSVSPCIITPCDREEYLYLILPVRMV